MGDRLATIDMGPKVGAAVPLSMGDLGHHLTQCCMDRGHLRTMYRQDRQTHRQRSDTDSIGRTVLQTVAKKSQQKTLVIRAYRIGI